MASVNKVKCRFCVGVLYWMYSDLKMSLPMISKMLSIPQSNIRRMLIKSGVKLRSRADGIRLVPGLNSNRRGVKREPFTDEHKRKISESRKKSACFKGVSLKPNGYYEHTRGPHKGRAVHVVLMEQYIGRKLLIDEVVHHKNFIKTDNRIENLQLMKRSKHAKIHRNRKASA